jgi:hypothetical protein
MSALQSHSQETLSQIERWEYERIEEMDKQIERQNQASLPWWRFDLRRKRRHLLDLLYQDRNRTFQEIAWLREKQRELLAQA